MRLTVYTDYALRTLMYLATHRDCLVTIGDIAELHGISKNHLMKVVNQLHVMKVVEAVRGRNGGLRLGMEPQDINIGQIVRDTEPDFFMAECFDRDNNSCIYTPGCKLKRILRDATEAYLNTLDGVTLDTLIRREDGQLNQYIQAKMVSLRPHKKTGAVEDDG